jgi:predicted small lipoprotein YifL
MSSRAFRTIASLSALTAAVTLIACGSQGKPTLIDAAGNAETEAEQYATLAEMAAASDLTIGKCSDRGHHADHDTDAS